MNGLNRFFIENNFFLTCLETIRQGEECFLVGGALRDVLLGRSCADYDLIVPDDPTALAQRFAQKVKGSWFILDPERRHSRVVSKNPQGNVFFDFAPFRSSSLEDDLRDRDFTINAMALPLHTPNGKIFDPLSGQEDLRNGFLRSCSEKSFINDPLRLLRGVRLALQLGMEIETHSFFLMKKAVDLLNRVAAERIKKELGLIFSLKNPSQAVFYLEELELNDRLWGVPGPHGSVARGALWIEKCCSFLSFFDQETILQSLDECAEEGFSKVTLIKLGLFLRGYELQKNKSPLKNLRFSRKSASLLEAIQNLPESCFHDWYTLRCGERGRALWVESLGRHALELLVVLAVLKASNASQAQAFVSNAWEIFLDLAINCHLPNLVEARALREEGINERSLSKVLEAIRREEIAGRIHNPDEALIFARTQRKRD